MFSKLCTGVGDDEADIKEDKYWAGVVPLRMVSEPPISDPRLGEETRSQVPAYLHPYEANSVVARDGRQPAREVHESGQKWEALFAIFVAIFATFIVRVIYHFTMDGSVTPAG